MSSWEASIVRISHFWCIFLASHFHLTFSWFLNFSLSLFNQSFKHFFAFFLWFLSHFYPFGIQSWACNNFGCGISIDSDLKMQQIYLKYNLKFFPWEHAPRTPYRLAPSALVHAAISPQTSLNFTWQGWNLWNAYSLVNHLNINSGKGPQTNLVTRHLFPVAMTCFRSVASVIFEPLMNICSRRESYSILPEKELTEG